jgi:RNA polymerase sigma-70 factor, ECF subfamily
MTDLAASFEEHRSHLRQVAYRMLGATAEADDAVQDAWLKLARADVTAVENMRAWLTTVVSRVCLDMLRSRSSRREDSLTAAPETTAPASGEDRELAESVGLALLVVLDKLDPAERIAFVLHDLFTMPFELIAPIVGRTIPATRQLASRARRRVQGASAPEVDLKTQQSVVEAFIAALRAGDIDALVAVLDPDSDVVIDGKDGGFTTARAWASGAVQFKGATQWMRPIVIDGNRVGIALAPHGKLQRVLVFGYKGALINHSEVITEADAVAELQLSEVP